MTPVSNKEDTINYIQEVLNSHSKEVQSTSIMLGLMMSDLSGILQDESASRQKFKSEIIKSIDEIPLGKLILLSYLTRLMKEK
ncbi:hypothetical protein [Bacillus manliponensis]|uniref:hypothetical protein n=1 Tax=Bacillus manliponensis TaxID=574376 RepID=UPI0035158891